MKVIFPLPMPLQGMSGKASSFMLIFLRPAHLQLSQCVGPLFRVLQLALGGVSSPSHMPLGKAFP